MTKQQLEKLAKVMYTIAIIDVVLALLCVSYGQDGDALVFLFLAAMNILGSMVSPNLGKKND